MAITNWHVIDYYRQERKKSDSIIFQVNKIKFDPDEFIIDESKKLDLAILSPFDSSNCHYCTVASWPPPRAKKGDIVVFSGCPGNFVDKNDLPIVQINSVPFFETVHDVSDDHLTLHRNLEECELTDGTKNMKDFKNLGGYSGSLVLKLDQSNLIKFLVPVAIIYEGHSDWQIQNARHLDIIDDYGKIIY